MTERMTRTDFLAICYLVAPLALFLACWTRLWIGIPATVAICYHLAVVGRDIDWRARVTSPANLALSVVAALAWAFMSGGIGPVLHTSDWQKHYAIFNTLVDSPWPARSSAEILGGATLRYYVGWYLVPAAAAKVVSAWIASDVLLWLWTSAGIALFFHLFVRAIEVRSTALVAIAIVAFVLFSGWDWVGTTLTGFRRGPALHVEWWAGWMQYPSNTTALLWVPQHALAAWLGTILAMRLRAMNDNPAAAALIIAALLLWSPFAAVGAAPFFLSWRQHVREPVVFWPATFVILAAIPVVLYLTANTDGIPKGFAWSPELPPMMGGGPPFSWAGYAGFLLLEIGVYAIALWLTGERGWIFATAMIALFTLPLVRVGMNSDLATRACMPALTVLAILCVRRMMAGPWRVTALLVLALCVGAPTAIGEMWRDAMVISRPISPSSRFDASWPPDRITQYFTPEKVRILRQP